MQMAETVPTSPSLSPSEENMHQDDISDDNHDMEEEVISSEVVDFEQCALEELLRRSKSAALHTLCS